MKRGVEVFAVFAVLISFASASVTVGNFSMQSVYEPAELISGTIDLTIEDEPFNEIISSNAGDEITLKDFLDANFADYDCSSAECDMDYEAYYRGRELTVDITSGQVEYMGFVLSGSGVYVDGIDFVFESDFGSGMEHPLSVEFFERDQWNFNSFSDSFSSSDAGCYDDSQASYGPFIRDDLVYCEIIPFLSTGAVKVGAVVDDGEGDLRMKVYDEFGDNIDGDDCTYNPTESSEGCVIELNGGEIFEERNYWVCVAADDDDTSYKIKAESSGENCGFVFANGPASGINDYGIYAMMAEYEDASHIDMGDLEMVSLANYADSLIESKYNRDCENLCYLPLAVTGVAQSFTLRDLDLRYHTAGGRV